MPPLPAPAATGAVLSVTYAATQTIVLALVARDAWRNRWNEKFDARKIDDTDTLDPGEHAATDTRAFIASLYDDTPPRISWPRVLAAPLLAAALITTAWAALTTIAAALT